MSANRVSANRVIMESRATVSRYGRYGCPAGPSEVSES